MKARQETIVIRLAGEERTVAVPGHENLFSALAVRLPFLDAPCQGRGLCGACRARLVPAPPAGEADRAFLSGQLLRDGWRLLCQHLRGHVREIELPAWSDAAIPPPERALLGGPPGDAGAAVLPHLCAAIDLGTTNLSVQLVDLAAPALVGTAGGGNPQTRYGTDVLSRIMMASRPRGLDILRGAVIKGINKLLASLREDAGLGDIPLREVMVAANPAMASILAGIDPSSLVSPDSAPPGLPTLLRDMAAAGLDLDPSGLVRLVPASSAFVGGDVTAGLVHCGAARDNGPATLFLDLGTNGEMVFWHRGRGLACSVASGPALEGGKVSRGMRAEPGAIASARLTGDVEFEVLGGGAPGGICGSGMLDLLAGLLGSGLLHPDGRFLSADEATHHPRLRLVRRLRGHGADRSFLLWGEGDAAIGLSQSDVRELQLAGAAVRTGIDILLSEAGVGPDRIERLLVAGAFGFHLDRKSLVATGFIPRAWEGMVEFVGNASLAGARECLLSEDSWERATRVSRLTEAIDLARHPRFTELFLQNISFPSPADLA